MTLGTQTQPYGKLLDYEQFIDHQLARTRARIKLTDIMTAGLTLLVGFLAVLFVEVVLDHIVGMPLMLRRIVLTAGLTTACTFSALRLVMPLMRRINSIYAAKTIENADSAFKNSLINYLELRRHRGLLPKTVMATIEARAVNDLTHVEIDGVVNQQRLMKMAYSLSAVIVVICLYSALTPKSVLDSAKRAFLADVVRPTNTQLLNIKPGENPELSKVVAGDNVNFAVNVEGTRPRKVAIHYSVDGGKFFAVKEFLPGRHMYDPWQVLMNNVQQSMDYYLTAGDAESLPYHLEVLPAPTVTSVTLDLKFPGYTKVEPRLNVEGGNIEAIEGTDVVVHAKTNMPASTATLNIVNKEPASMEIASDDATVLTGKIHVDKSGNYTIKFRTTGGQLNPNPVVYEIFAIPDRPPTAQFIQPSEPTVKVPANVKVDLDMRASDDHGVKDATLHVALGNENLVSKNLLEGQPPQPEFRGLETLDLAKLKVKPGAVLNYWLTVNDNKEPYSNKGETPRQVIEVIEPVSPTSKRQFEENARKERERLDPSPPATQDEQQIADQPPANQQRNPDEPANDAGAPGQEKNPAQVGAKGADGQSAPDKGQGNVDGANRDPQTGNSKDGNPPLSPEQFRDMQQRLKDALKNKGTDSNQANKGGTPNSSSSSSDNSAGADAARSRDPNNAAPAEKNAANRPPQDTPNRPGSTSPPTPPGANNPTGSSSDVAPGVRNQNQPATPPDQNEVPNPSTTPPGGKPQMGNQNGGNGTSGGADNQTPRPGQNPAGSPDDQPKSDSAASKKATPNDRSDSTQRDGSTKVPPADDRPRESQDPGSPQAPQAGGTNGSNGSSGAESKTGGDRPQTNENDPNSATGKKPRSGDMNKGDDGKPETDPATQPSRDGHEGAGKEPNSMDKSRAGQSKTKPGDQTNNPDGQPSNPDSKPGSEGSSADSKNASQGAEASKTARKDQSSDRRGSNEAGKNKNADGTEPNSDAKEGSGSKPGDSPDGSPKTSADQKPGSNTASQDSQDAMKANDSPRTKAAPSGKEAGDRESQPGAGKTKAEPKDKPVTDGQAADPNAGPESTPGAAKSKEDPQEKPRDSGKAAKPNANLKKKPGDKPAGPSEMNDSKVPGTSNGPKDAQAKGDQDQPADQKAMEKAGKPTRDQASKPKETGKTGANPDPQDPRNKDALNPKEQQTPRVRPENGVQEPKNPEDPAALQDPKKDPSVREPRNAMPADARKGEANEPKEPQKAPDEPVNSDQEPKRPQDPVTTKDRKSVPTARDPRNTVPADERTKEAPDPNAPQTPKAQRDPSKSPNQSGETRQQNPDDQQQPPKKPQTGDMQERQGDNPPSAANTQQTQPQEDPAEKRKGASQRKSRSRDAMKADRPDEDMRQRQGDLDRLKAKPKPEDAEKTEEEKKQEEEQKEEDERKKPRTSEDTPLERQNPGRPNDRTLPPPSQERDRSALPDRESQAQSPDQVRNSRQTTRNNSPKNMPKDAQQSSPQLDPSSQTGQPGKPKGSQAGQTRQEQEGKSGVSGEKIKGAGSESGKEIAGSERSGGQEKPSGEGNEPTSKSGGQPGGKPGSGDSPQKSSSSEGGKPESGKPSQESSSSQGEKPGSGGSQAGKPGSPGQGGSKGQRPGRQSGTQGGGQESSEPPSADRPGEGGRNSNGGGGSSRSGGTASEPAKDNTQPTPRATEPENAPNRDDVAPKGASQTELNLRTLQDVLKDPVRTKDLEKDTGLNREQLEQFVRQYEKMKSGPAGPGREIEVKPGEQSNAQPSANLPGVDPNTPFATRTLRGRETVSHDDIRNNQEGVRSQVPSEWRAKYQGYRNKLSKPTATKPKVQPSSKPAK